MSDASRTELSLNNLSINAGPEGGSSRPICYLTDFVSRPLQWISFTFISEANTSALHQGRRRNSKKALAGRPSGPMSISNAHISTAQRVDGLKSPFSIRLAL